MRNKKFFWILRSDLTCYQWVQNLNEDDATVAIPLVVIPPSPRDNEDEYVILILLFLIFVKVDVMKEPVATDKDGFVC